MLKVKEGERVNDIALIYYITIVNFVPPFLLCSALNIFLSIQFWCIFSDEEKRCCNDPMEEGPEGELVGDDEDFLDEEYYYEEVEDDEDEEEEVVEVSCFGTIEL